MSKIKKILPVLILMVGQTAFSKDYAMVFVGPTLGLAVDNPERELQVDPDDPSKTIVPQHNFAKADAATALGLKSKGYEVTTFFDTLGIDTTKLQKPVVKAIAKNGPSEGSGIEIGPISPKDFQPMPDKPAKDTGASKKDPAFAAVKFEAPKDQAAKIDFFHKAFAADMSFYKDKVGASGAATMDNLRGYFESLISKVASGDKVRIVINSHGYAFCNGSPQRTIPVDIETRPECEHRFDMVDPVTGELVKVSSKDLVPYLKRLEAKGAKIDLDMASCFSGTLRRELSDLKNTCTMLAAPGDNVSHMCFESDPVTATDYSSVSSIMLAQAYLSVADQLKKDPYFQNSKCLGNLQTFQATHHLPLAGSRRDLFIAARSRDTTTDEAKLSSFFNTKYFGKGHISAEVIINKEICEADVTSDLDSLESTFTAVQKEIFRTSRQKLQAAIAAYMAKYNEKKAFVRSLDQARASAADAQKAGRLDSEIAALGKVVIATERDAVDQVLRLVPADPNDPCTRPQV